jgi:hypothetical protein
MAQRSFRFIEPSHFRKSERRAVGFLESEDKDLNAKEVYDSLERKPSYDLNARIDWWLEGNDVPKNYFHGWDIPEYRECFAFKRAEDRFYGFKCHPKPTSSMRFILCVLVFYDSKHAEDTNFALLDRINVLRENRDVTAAITAKYPEYRG